MASIGQIIDGKYEILKLIGQGGMSRVYLAMDKRLNKQWAVKEIEKRTRDKNNDIVIQSAIAEANMIKQLDHPSIVRIVDIIDNGDVIYIIEDYIEGETLSTILDNNGAQPQEMVVEWGMQICEALHYLHTRTPPIIYRDMKPANVMLKPDGNIQIIDFGIAREYKDHALADTVVLGTKGYAAPEQYGGRGQTDARTDVYCLGVTLYHLLTGHNPGEPPYEIYPIRHWNPQLSSGLEKIIQKCTQLNPADRYQSCAELLGALNHYEEYDEEYRKKQKRKLNAFIATVGVMVGCALVGVFGLAMRTQTNNADYDQNILQAQNASTSEEKVEYYYKAIEIKPTETEAYLGLIEAFKDDAVFSHEDEEQAFLSLVNSNETELQEESGYGELMFEIGKLYWYYYDYGSENSTDNQATRTASAAQWFKKAIDSGTLSSADSTMAEVYYKIGDFNKNITQKINEASDQDEYKPYWNNIVQLVNLVTSGSDNSEIVELETYKLAMNAIETYARKFKNVGVSQSEMQSLFDTVSEAAEKVSTTSDKTEQIQSDVISRIDDTQSAIDNAYRE